MARSIELTNVRFVDNRRYVIGDDVSTTIAGAFASGVLFWRLEMVLTTAATLLFVPAQSSMMDYCQSVFFEISASESYWFIFCQAVEAGVNIILSSRCSNSPGYKSLTWKC